MSFAAEVKEWINEIIKNEKLRFHCADIEIRDPDKKRGDLIVWEKRGEKAALLIEIWDARTPPWEEALDSALAKAWRNNIPYFAIWNLTHFYCWDALMEGDAIDKLWWPHAGVSEKVTDALTYEDAILRYKESIKSYLKSFLKEFEQVYYGIRAKPLLGIDERFIYRLRGTIYALSIPVFEELRKRAQENVEFRKELIKHFREQGWTFKGTDEDFEKVARQYVYLLANKILFYNMLRFTPHYKSLPKIVIPSVGLTGEQLRDKLNSYFELAYEATGNYETILLADFLESIIPPDEVVGRLRDFIYKIGEYDFSKISYEILGNIFQRLIPEEERHKLGQYFTRSDVVDLIVGFCVRSADDKVLDGGCGAGTFLVRSYARKKQLNPNKTHKELIKELFGVDIARFPAHLSIINLSSRDLSEIENYPRIFHRDFFETFPDEEYRLSEVRYKAETLGKKEFFAKIPKYVDAVVMNPPYTRQEEMEDVLEEEKEKAYKVCINDWKELSHPKYQHKEPKLSKRSSIYAHFFIHGARFLRDGGRMGLITSNSWLDVNYGGDLQRFFLENFKIIAIIESKVERWFEDADINTAITILERCNNPEERNNNLVKFVQLKRPLSEFIPPTEDEGERWVHVEKLIKFIEFKNQYFEDENIRIFVKRQGELWDEGYDEETGEYVGSKWGKYIRAPEIFFKILEKGKDLFIPLKEVAEVRRGFTTGANEFFYLTEDEIQKYGIEREFWMHPLRRDEEIPIPEHVWKDKGGEYFKTSQYTGRMPLSDVLRDDGYVYWIPNYVIKSPRECKSILVDPRNLKYRVLLIHKDKKELRGTNILKYIEWGESQGFHQRPTCSTRQRWYELEERPFSHGFWIYILNDRYVTFLNSSKVLADCELFDIYPKSEEYADLLIAILNSTLTSLFSEVESRLGLGLGALKKQVCEVKRLLVPKIFTSPFISRKIINQFKDMITRPVGSIFDEINANSPAEVSLDKVRPDRRELDRIIMDEFLRLTDEEQLEIYKAVVDLVRSRLERARSVQKKKKVEGLNVDNLVDSVLKELEEIHGIKAKAFPEDYIGECKCRIVEVPRGSKVESGNDLEGPYVQIDDEKIRCTSIYEAWFIEYAVLAGKTRIKIPEDEDILKKAVEERGRLLRDAKTKINEFIEEMIADRKLREKVRFEAFRRLGIR